MQADAWLPLAQAHRERVEPWIAGRLERRPKGISHPVDDFLFEYYPFSPSRLATWHPGAGVVLEGDEARAYLKLAGYRAVDDAPRFAVTADLDWLQAHRPRLDLAIRILAGTAERPPVTGCFGLHEWAMVYGLEQSEVRHSTLPLRLAPTQIAETVDDIGLRCTHIDAYRFFTDSAAPRNALVPTRATQPELEQPGCLHASMDLYKYAMWFQPYAGSDLVADCFEVARSARELDMRASPYDVTEFGLEPIRVETVAGRRAYADAQRALMARTAPLRQQLQASLTALAGAIADPTGCSMFRLPQDF